MFITKEQIKILFDKGAYQRGKKYFLDGKVNYVKYDKDTDSFNASVKGKGRTYYVNLRANHFISSSCSCPVAYMCKHGVAVALTIMDEFQNDELEDPYISQTDPAANNVINLFKPKKEKTIKTDFAKWMTKAKKSSSVASDKKKDSSNLEPLSFILDKMDRRDSNLFIEAKRLAILKSGKKSKGAKVSLNGLLQMTTGFDSNWRTVPISDQEIAKAMDIDDRSYGYEYEISDPKSIQALIKIVQTGRCYWKELGTLPFSFNKNPKKLEFRWNKNEPYKLNITLEDIPLSIFFEHQPIVYLNLDQKQLGFIDPLVEFNLLKSLTTLPELSKDEVKELIVWLTDWDQAISLPEEVSFNKIEGSFRPELKIFDDGKDFYAKYLLNYGDFSCEYGKYPLRETSYIKIDKEFVQWDRDLITEEIAQEQLFLELSRYLVKKQQSSNISNMLKEIDQSFWVHFNNEIKPSLEDLGWIITFETELKLPEIITIDNIDGEIIDDEYADWFELGLSVEINNRKINMVPLIVQAMLSIDSHDELPEFLLFPIDGDFLRVEGKKLAPIIKILSQLMDHQGRIPRIHVSILNDIPFVNKWSGGEKLLRLAEKLSNFTGLEAIEPPKNFNAKLRDYQQVGLNWLQFLQSYGFGGILADDMGLGKTVQALAIMQLMFERGDLNHPIFVICPTSLIGNWKRETELFAPDLKVLVLHGTGRKKSFETINDHHLIISTYPLICKDLTLHEKNRYSFIILDEAQVIKNPKAKLTQAVKKLNGENRLCLTGTPMENHLGELWSLFDFVMPGYLDDHKGFNNIYKKPIENGEQYAQEWLNKRISPFLLRRTKDHVAKELPKKTVIIQKIILPKDQRLLYESIRVSMEKRVRELLENKGMAKSHIEFLDALLKLRQACCDPRIVKLEEAKKIETSAKLSFLLEVVPEMIAEGRKILIFSQFTQMLSIIEKELKALKIKTCKLTGQTKKRDEVISEFTSGRADLFLISLKAGGVGLNLTEADTVIHFDPWWNPAAENQATDRAYRIGQDKPVFVYKLVAEDTIEEKILTLQEKKQAMADGLYGEGADRQVATLSKMDATQLLSLFE